MDVGMKIRPSGPPGLWFRVVHSRQSVSSLVLTSRSVCNSEVESSVGEHGCSLGGPPCHCDSTSPTLVVEAFTSTINGSSGLGCARVGDVQKDSLRV